MDSLTRSSSRQGCHPQTEFRSLEVGRNDRLAELFNDKTRKISLMLVHCGNHGCLANCSHKDNCIFPKQHLLSMITISIFPLLKVIRKCIMDKKTHTLNFICCSFYQPRSGGMVKGRCRGSLFFIRRLSFWSFLASCISEYYVNIVRHF